MPDSLEMDSLLLKGTHHRTNGHWVASRPDPCLWNGCEMPWQGPLQLLSAFRCAVFLSVSLLLWLLSTQKTRIISWNTHCALESGKPASILASNFKGLEISRRWDLFPVWKLPGYKLALSVRPKMCLLSKEKYIRVGCTSPLSQPVSTPISASWSVTFSESLNFKVSFGSLICQVGVFT